MIKVFSFSIFFVFSQLSANALKTEEFYLDNGLRCILIENKFSPAIHYSWWINVGGADEKPHKSGLAHFLEHMVFKGTNHLKAGEFDQLLHKMGAQFNAATGFDTTHYFIQADKKYLEKIIETEADRLVNLKITKKIFDAEKKVILEERKTRIDNQPEGIAFEQTLATLFSHHPYRTPVIGWENEIRNLSLKDIKTFYKQYYSPNNTTLIIAGDINKHSLEPLIKKYYGDLKPSKIEPRQRVVEPEGKAYKRIYLSHSQVKQSSLFKIFKVPAYLFTSSTDYHQKNIAIEFIISLLGGSSSDFLYNRLVRERKIALSIQAGFIELNDHNLISIQAEPKENVTLEVLEKAIDEEIESFLKAQIDEKKFELKKKNYIAQETYKLDSLSAPVSLVGNYIFRPEGISYVKNFLKIAQSIALTTIEDLKAKLFTPKESACCYLLPSNTS